MKAPFDDKSISDRPRRPARSIRELKRRQLADSYQSPFARIIYALLNALLYGVGGILIDVGIAVVRSIMGVGNGDVFWLFTPFLLIIGAIIGFIDGKNAGADSMDMITNTASPLDDNSIRHDIFKGIGKGILICAVIWLIMMITT